MKAEKFYRPAPVLTPQDLARCRSISGQHHSIVHEVVVSVSAETGVGIRDIYGNRRGQMIAHARQLAMYIAARGGVSIAAIGRALNRDHSTVSHGIKAEERRRQSLNGLQANVGGDRMIGPGGATNAQPGPDQHRTVRGFKMQADAAITPDSGRNAITEVSAR
jgi:hypothetical protein